MDDLRRVRMDPLRYCPEQQFAGLHDSMVVLFQPFRPRSVSVMPLLRLVQFSGFCYRNRLGSQRPVRDRLRHATEALEPGLAPVHIWMHIARAEPEEVLLDNIHAIVPKLLEVLTALPGPLKPGTVRIPWRHSVLKVLQHVTPDGL